MSWSGNVERIAADLGEQRSAIAIVAEGKETLFRDVAAAFRSRSQIAVSVYLMFYHKLQ
jgi:hypothetical protein